MKIEVEVTPQSREALIVRLAKKSKLTERQVILGIRDAVRHLESTVQRDFLTGQYLKVRTGTLRRSIYHRMFDAIREGRVGIGPEAPYGPMLHRGTRPHTIFPKNRRALRFKVGGRTIFAKRVEHPGTKPKPFLHDALKRERSRIRQIIAEQVRKGIAE